eukprot:Skav217533  [mRNA]  locus=scaffold5248:870:3519:- [translate_table: standard]
MKSCHGQAAKEENFQPIYHCSRCPTRSFASKRTWLLSLPPVLPVQLKRFRYDQHSGQFQKSRVRIRTPSTLDLSDLLLSSDAWPSDGDNVRVAAKVCSHLGGSMERGHYVAFINAGASLQEEAWYLLDDARSIPVTRDDALRVEAYIAFYRRVTAAE